MLQRIAAADCHNMNWDDLLEYLLFFSVLTATVRPLGAYLARVFCFQDTFLDRILVPVESMFMRCIGPAALRPMQWREYFLCFSAFGLAGAVLMFLILNLQQWLPGYGLLGAKLLTTPMSTDLALNTAVSFATTTTWQAYGGETTLSYSSQLLALVSQNFLASAAGLAVGIAFIRGIAVDGSGVLGNFWRDLLRAVLWVLLPLSIPGALLLVWLGVPMNWDPYTSATTLEGGSQVIAQGPVAALEFIKNLGTNGGGFFNVNGAHPYANPTALTNLVGMLAIAMIPAALCYTLGRMTGHQRHGWLLYCVMTAMFALGLVGVHLAESGSNPALLRAIEPQQLASGTDSMVGNLEGKEVRFGIGSSTLAVVTTSNGATGSYAAMHDSLAPLGGAIALFNMLLGEVTYGGLGTGLISMLLAVLLAVFLGGLMTGRAPAYLGNQLGIAEIKLVALAALVAPCTILMSTAVAVRIDAGLAGLSTNTGAHGLTSIAFAYASSFANNGQNFAGLAANSPFYNYSTAAVMLAGRFLSTLAALALAGAFAAQRRRAISSGALPADAGAFAVLLLGVLVLMGALSFLPLLCLGPVAEHMMIENLP